MPEYDILVLKLYFIEEIVLSHIAAQFSLQDGYIVGLKRNDESKMSVSFFFVCLVDYPKSLRTEP